MPITLLIYWTWVRLQDQLPTRNFLYCMLDHFLNFDSTILHNVLHEGDKLRFKVLDAVEKLQWSSSCIGCGSASQLQHVLSSFCPYSSMGLSWFHCCTVPVTAFFTVLYNNFPASFWTQFSFWAQAGWLNETFFVPPSGPKSLIQPR